MADEIRYLPPGLTQELRYGTGVDLFDVLDDDAVWKLERLLEAAFADGYKQAYTRGYQCGHDAARARQRRDQAAATPTTEAGDTP